MNIINRAFLHGARRPTTATTQKTVQQRATPTRKRRKTQTENESWERDAGHTCVPEIGEDKGMPRGLPEKCDFAVGDAEQRPSPAAKDATPTQEPTADIEEVIDIDSEESESAPGTDDEPQRTPTTIIVRRTPQAIKPTTPQAGGASGRASGDRADHASIGGCKWPPEASRAQQGTDASGNR